MNAKNPGLTFKETMAGGFDLGVVAPNDGLANGRRNGMVLAMHAEIVIDDLEGFIEDPSHLGGLSGTVDFPPLGTGLVAETGIFNLFSPTHDPKTKFMVYEMAFQQDGQPYYLAGRKEVRDDPGFDLWPDTTTLFTTLHKGGDKRAPIAGAGILSLGVTDLIKLLSTVKVLHTDSLVEKSKAVARFGKFFLGELWDSYARFASEKA